MVRLGASQRPKCDETCMYALPWNEGFFGRDDVGRILVNGGSHSRFAASGRGLIMTLYKPDSQGVLTENYKTRSTSIHHRVHFGKGPSDPVAALQNVIDAAYDWASGLLIATGFPLAVGGGITLEGLAFYKDLGPGLEGALNVAVYEDTGYYDSGHVLDAAGMLPWLGSVPDLGNALLQFTGWQFYVTP
jgi:hypothetical protein